MELGERAGLSRSANAERRIAADFSELSDDDPDIGPVDGRETITNQIIAPVGGLRLAASGERDKARSRYRLSSALRGASSDRAPDQSVSARRASGNVTSHGDRRNYSLAADFTNLLPDKPYCADYLDGGLVIRSKSVALKRRHIQPNGPSTFQWMPHDIDQAGAYHAHKDANLPPPNIIAINPANGHAHSWMLLEVPVARHSASKLAPLRYYAAIERGFARRLNADRRYAGLIAKNPLHPDWRVEWRRDEPYTLEELESWLFERDMRPDLTPQVTFGAGRNVTLFDDIRSAAYREFRHFKTDGASFEAWQSRCLTLASGGNLKFADRLPQSEVRSIARSIAKWTWRNMRVLSDDEIRAHQSRRGKLGMARRWAGHVAAESTKPWAAEGISRATWYRRKKGGAA